MSNILFLHQYKIIIEMLNSQQIRIRNSPQYQQFCLQQRERASMKKRLNVQINRLARRKLELTEKISLLKDISEERTTMKIFQMQQNFVMDEGLRKKHQANRQTINMMRHQRSKTSPKVPVSIRERKFYHSQYQESEHNNHSRNDSSTFNRSQMNPETHYLLEMVKMKNQVETDLNKTLWELSELNFKSGMRHSRVLKRPEANTSNKINMKNINNALTDDLDLKNSQCIQTNYGFELRRRGK